MRVQSQAVVRGNVTGRRCRLASRGYRGRVRRSPSRGAGGFTLIELLVVIGIIAVLAAIVIPVYTRAQEKGRQARCISNMHSIALAMGMYHMDYHDYPPVYEPVSGTGGITALYHGEYLTDPQSLRCPNDTTTLADYMTLYGTTNKEMKTTVWEPGPPPTQTTYTGPTILELENPLYGQAWDNTADKGVYFREHYSTYNCQPIDPVADDNGAATVPYQLYNYYGYTSAGRSHLAKADANAEYPATRKYPSTSVKFAGLCNSNAPETTIITHCPWHRDYFGGAAAWQDIVVRGGGNAELMRITGYDWINQPPQ